MSGDRHNVHITAVTTLGGFRAVMVGQRCSDNVYEVAHAHMDLNRTLDGAIANGERWAREDHLPFDDPRNPVNPEFHGLRTVKVPDAPPVVSKVTLEDQIRERIGQGGPQLATEEYEQRIEDELDAMTARELLTHISGVLS